MIYEFIIEEVRKKPFVYDKSHVDYKNEDLKKDLFDFIAQKIYEIWEIEMTGINVRGIWDDLKREFKEDYLKMKKQPSGSGFTYPLAFPYYNNLLFLIDHINKHRAPLSSVENLKKKFVDSTVNSIWSYPKEKTATATITNSNEKFILNEDESAPRKVPRWDSKAEMKLKNQGEVIEIMKEANHIMKEGSSKIVKIMEKESTEDSYDEYCRVFHNQFKKIHENDRDDCLVNIVNELQKLQ